MKNSKLLKSIKLKETDLGYSLALVVPSTVLVGRQEICVAVFNSNIPENVDYYIKLASTKISKIVKANRVNNSAITFITPEYFPPGNYQISVHQGPGQHLVCNYDVPFTFSSKLDFVKNLLETSIDPISVIADAFELKVADCTAVDFLLEKHFKLNIPSNFSLLQNHQFDRNKNSDFSLFSMPTLLHFAAHYNLVRLSIALLKCPGAEQLLMTKNCRGLTPIAIATENGHSVLAGALSEFMNNTPNQDNLRNYILLKPDTEDCDEPNGLNDKRYSVSSRISVSSTDSGIENSYGSSESQSCHKPISQKLQSTSNKSFEEFEESDILYDVPSLNNSFKKPIPPPGRTALGRTISLPNVRTDVGRSPQSYPEMPLPGLPGLPPNNCSARLVERFLPTPPARIGSLKNNTFLEHGEYSNQDGGNADIPEIYETLTSPCAQKQVASVCNNDNDDLYDNLNLSKNLCNARVEMDNNCEEIYDTPPSNQSYLNDKYNRNQYTSDNQKVSQKPIVRRQTAPGSMSSYESVKTVNPVSNKSIEEKDDKSREEKDDKSREEKDDKSGEEKDDRSREEIEDYGCYVEMSSALSDTPVQQGISTYNNEDLYDNPTKSSDSDNEYYEYEKFNYEDPKNDLIYDVPSPTYTTGHKTNLLKKPDRFFTPPHKTCIDDVTPDTSNRYQIAASRPRRRSLPAFPADTIMSLNSMSRPPALPPRQANNSIISSPPRQAKNSIISSPHRQANNSIISSPPCQENFTGAPRLPPPRR